MAGCDALAGGRVRTIVAILDPSPGLSLSEQCSWEAVAGQLRALPANANRTLKSALLLNTFSACRPRAVRLSPGESATVVKRFCCTVQDSRRVGTTLCGVLAGRSGWL